MKKITIGIIIGLLIGLSSQGFAAVGDVIEAKFSQFTFVVDGEVKSLESNPLNYQGTTYLPVRIVANLLGKDVVYKADTRTIEITTPIEQIQGEEELIVGYNPSIDQLKSDLESARNTLTMYQMTLDSVRTENLGGKLEQDALNSIEETERRIADLEQQLADLQAQL